ncbi:hypothetical protein ACROYT_G015119 [Oculina patagonica]
MDHKWKVKANEELERKLKDQLDGSVNVSEWSLRGVSYREFSRLETGEFPCLRVLMRPLEKNFRIWKRTLSEKDSFPVNLLVPETRFFPG